MGRPTSFKTQCATRGITGSAYWRALKRREAGMDAEQVFALEYVRAARRLPTTLTVYGVTYPNLAEAMRALEPPASEMTLIRWLRRGMTPDEAFTRVPNPGYANGLIYLVTHTDSGKRYVGLTVQTLERRWLAHQHQAQARSHNGISLFHEVLRANGPEAFTLAILDRGTTKRDLEAKERAWIQRYKTLVPHGYNMHPGGVSGGAHGKQTCVDGRIFARMADAAAYVAETRGISLEAAKYRIRHQCIDAPAPARPGEGVYATKEYKAWSAMVHVMTNPRSTGYIHGAALYAPWRDFAAFLHDAGYAPAPEMVWARKEKAHGFTPVNCAWMSNKAESSRINAAWMKAQGRLTGRPPKQKAGQAHG